MTSEHSAQSRMPEKPSLDGIESKWATAWEAQDAYAFDRSKTRAEVYSIDTPHPPSAGRCTSDTSLATPIPTASLATNGMQGKAVFYPMGWDDNGLPTERRVQNYFGVRCDPSCTTTRTSHHPRSPGKTRSQFHVATSSSCVNN